MEKEFEAVAALLDASRAKYTAFDHEPVYTSEEAARVRGVPLSSGVKALVFKCVSAEKAAEVRGSDYFVLILVRGDHKADTRKIKALTKSSDISLATPEKVFAATGCEIGSVHPFGNLMGLRTIMDKTILENENVNFNAGMHTKSVAMRAEDMQRIIRAEVADIAK